MIADVAIAAAAAVWRTADGIHAGAAALERLADGVNELGHGILRAHQRLEEALTPTVPTQEEINRAIRAGLDPDELRDLEAASLQFYATGGAG